MRKVICNSTGSVGTGEKKALTVLNYFGPNCKWVATSPTVENYIFEQSGYFSFHRKTTS